MGKYFGTDGFRGEANVVLTVEHAFKVGRYLGWYFGQDHKARIVIGKDTRRSSYMFEYALAAGLTASGADAYLLHVTTTPSVSYVVRTEDFDCGIMIWVRKGRYLKEMLSGFPEIKNRPIHDFQFLKGKILSSVFSNIFQFFPGGGNGKNVLCDDISRYTCNLSGVFVERSK